MNMIYTLGQQFIGHISLSYLTALFYHCYIYGPESSKYVCTDWGDLGES